MAPGAAATIRQNRARSVVRFRNTVKKSSTRGAHAALRVGGGGGPIKRDSVRLPNPAPPLTP